MKRFTDTAKWKDKWFRKLPAPSKLLFIYLLDNCDNAGFVEVDFDYWAYSLGITEKQTETAFNKLKDRVEIQGEWCLVVNFLRHQKNLPLNPENNAHKQIISLLDSKKELFKNSVKYQDILGANKGLNSPIGKGIVKVKVDILEENQNFLEAQCRLHKCKIEELQKHLARFVDKCYPMGETEKSLEEVFSHCANWLAKQDIEKIKVVIGRDEF